jgi:hypothetical protein
MNNFNFGPVSKAIAGAVAGLIIAALARWNINLGGEYADALETLINGVVAALIGYGVVYLAPRNQDPRI